MTPLIKTFAVTCHNTYFFGLPTWYHYLPMNSDCTPKFTGLNDTWLVVAAIIEMLLRIAGLVAVFMVIYGGITFITSQGNPEEAKRARSTLIYALVGLLLAASAALIVSFIATSIGA
jgi:hypothetical protein